MPESDDKKSEELFSKFEECFASLEKASEINSETQDPISAAENYTNMIAEHLVSKYGKDKALDIVITVASISMGKSVYGMSNGRLIRTDLTNISGYLKELGLDSEEYVRLIEFGNCWKFFRETSKRPPYIRVLNK